MELIVLTIPNEDPDTADAEGIFINPMHVAAITSADEGTMVYLAGGQCSLVRESVAYAVKEVDSVLKQTGHGLAM